jgi:preprotein translocase subunit SecD
MARLFSIMTGCLLSLGCDSPGTEFQRSGNPALTLEVRRASTETVEGWEAGTHPGTQQTLFLSPQQELSIDDVASTGVQLDDSGNWQIVMRLNDAAKKTFAELSTELVDAEKVQTQGSTSKRLAVLVDGKVIVAPVVISPITDGVIHIHLSGSFTEQDARRIAKGIVSP